ncbi:UPC2-regulatory involved in control of sterol uptake [Emericellopsis cladophorae]|uniref:UPC2-regulatory involved in control of sterol uptake n=1 Tax=Emericellopsis cladophorae TaxID=2686198 RepID=A0A9P9Y976_9HYPO|nr:UPC2-regulatory involved in control of sterol uptake [Emericellopsis cladophorae]KAI6785114.1 UPC2-regulatory involved in control of sterol uptake [Emericellopsis cladophorae]
MASLQIAKLQGCPPTAAHRHYHLALRRVAKNVTLDHKRRQPATLAAILLLAYFEVWSSEHTKWTSHLYGARMIFTEIPLLAMARRCLPLKRQQHLQQRRMMNWLNTDLEADFDLDYDLLTTITGARITASHYNLDPELVVPDKGAPPTARDIESFETLADLYWWYCKMDVYQCMLSGTKLFMPYRLWTQCPPRAPASSMASIYGTYDHLLLLLGRLAEFASRDMARKRAASRARNSPPTGSPSPPFSGMLPTQGPFRAPRGFDSPQSDPRKDAHDVDDADASYTTALQEWQDICHAFGAFEKYLGKDFGPLSAEFADNRPTPFGPSRQYRTFSVAGIWMNYNMGMIHLYRSHPDMPPTALQSVGLAAKQTGYHAQEIGRIAAGLSGESSAMDKLHNALAAAYIESAFCLFFAAVQSARHIAHGCESGWIKAAELGRGPPYTRLATEDKPAESVWTSARRIDRRIQELRDSSSAEGTGDGKIILPMTERAHYAVGLLGIESDFNHLELTDDVFHGSR